MAEMSGSMNAIYVFYFLVGVIVVMLLFLSEGLKEHVEGGESSKPNVGVFVKVCPRCGSTDVELDTELFKGMVQAVNGGISVIDVASPPTPSLR